ncbi:iron reductase domain protein [Xylariaceae sp. FL0255]|nr:iron reductase domain protein [Xylariaceae sp. FL0255]
MQSLLAPVALGTALFGAFTGATLSKTINEDISYQIGVPEASASSNSGNIYLQLSAPTSYQWVALGTGSQMAGSNIFVMYADGTGNVTVSPRKGTGEVMPEYQSDTKLTLLAGSGVNGGKMVANLQCANCESWSGGSLTLTSTSSPFIAAYKEGSALDSTSLTETLQEHDNHYQFTLDLAQAIISTDSNPFTGANNGTNVSSGSGSGSGSDSTSSSGDDGDSDGDSLGSTGIGSKQLLTAHGVIMAVVMILLYPIGAILMPMYGSWLLHGVFQLIAFAGMWVGFAFGILLSQRTGIYFSATHTILGTVVVVLFGLQPIGGYLHHRHYLKHQARGAISHAHIWYGRALIILGIINGGLGLQLAGAGHGLVIGYSVVASVAYTAYIASAIWGEYKRRRNTSSSRQQKIMRI